MLSNKINGKCKTYHTIFTSNYLTYLINLPSYLQPCLTIPDKSNTDNK